MTDSHQHLLALAGFTPDEIKAELASWLWTANQLGLGEEDVGFAVRSWLPEQWDLDLFGVRQALGVLLRELMAVCRPESPTGIRPVRIYLALPFPPAIPLAIKQAGGNDVLVAAPEVLLNIAMGAIFHKLPSWFDSLNCTDFLGAACHRCGLNQIRVAAQTAGLIPPAAVTWTAGHLCDEAPKVEEYLECLGASEQPSIVCRLPQDATDRPSSDDRADRAELFKNQLRYGLDSLKQAGLAAVSDEALWAGIRRWQRYAFKLGRLNSLMLRSDPPPMGGFESALFALPLIMPFSTGLDQMESALQSILVEAGQRIAKRSGPVARGAPRILIYQIPFSQPRFSRLVEACGLALIGSLATIMKPAATARPTLEDPLAILGNTYIDHPEFSGLARQIEAIRDLVERYRPDGLITGLFDFDRRLGLHQPLLARIVRERTGCPAFYLEGDVWGRSEPFPGFLQNRLETIRETISKHKIRHPKELEEKRPLWVTCSLV